MTSEITLELDHHGVRLVRHGDEGDIELGQARLDDPGFADTLDAFRDDLSDDGAPVAANIVLPKDLVLFLDVGDRDQADVETSIAQETDCPLDTLTVARDGPVAAAVENTTLDEAREFATQHGFQPVAFHAVRNGKLTSRITLAEEPTEVPAFFSHRAALADAEDEPQAPDMPETAQPELPFQSVAEPEPAPPPFRPEPPRAAPQPAPTARNEAEAFTVFGARNREKPPAGFTRLHGIAAVIAAGVMLSVASLFIGGEETEVVEDTTIRPLDPAADPAIYDTAALDPEPEPEPAPAPPIEAEPAPRDVEIAAPTHDSADVAAPSADPVALPGMEVPASRGAQPVLATPRLVVDLPAVVFTPPPPAGYVFDMDENGLVVATEDGALTPDGILVYAGPPSPRPPKRAGDRAEAPAAAEETPEPPALAEEAAPEDPPAAIAEAEPPAEITAPPLDIASVRPRARPQRAAAEIAPTLAVFTPDADTPRPRSRPAAVTQRAAAARQAPAATDFDQLARQAQTPQTAAAGTAATTARAAAPTEPQGVQNVAVRPTQPTRGSVADRATVDNALRLNKVNLIGVYGSSSDRRALVRLPSGRYVKVKVGDRIDGGRVAAIRESRLEYTKGSQRYALTLPNS